MSRTITSHEKRRPRSGRRRSRLGAALTVIVTVVFPLLAAAPANADGPDPVGNLLGSVAGAVDGATRPVAQAAAQAGSGSGSNKAGTGTTKASSSTAAVGSHHASLAEVSGNQVGTDGSGTPRGKATLVGVVGHTVIGSHAAGGDTAHSQVPDNPLCQRSSGALCAHLLYADSATSSSSAATATGLAALCVGGNDPTGATCSGQQVGLAQGSARYSTDGTSSSAADLANVCLRVATSCGVGVELLGSTSGGTPAAQPVLLSVTLGATRIELPRDTSHLAVPSGCGAPDLLCAVLNPVQTGPGGDERHAVTAGVAHDLLVAAAGSSSSTTPAGQQAAAPVAATDGATAQLVDLGGSQRPLLGVSQNAASDNGSQANGDATLLSVLGTELVGAHSSSDGSSDGAQHRGVDTPLCTLTGGSACADLLYADSTTSHRTDGADADTDTGLASFCLIGSDPSGRTCSGLSVGLGRGESHFHRSADGARSASGTSLADACLASDTGCAVSGEVLASQGSADSNGRHDSSGSIAGVGLGGTNAGAPDDPIGLSVPTGCAGTTGSAACVLLDQNDQGATATGGVGATQSVLQLGLVDGGLGLTGAQTTAGVSQVSAPTTGTTVEGTPPIAGHPHTAVVSAAGGHAAGSGSMTPSSSAPAAAAFGRIPNTGGPWVGAIPLALALLIAGVLGLRRSWDAESAGRD